MMTEIQLKIIALQFKDCCMLNLTRVLLKDRYTIIPRTAIYCYGAAICICC
jgi:hypothetical protein